MMATERNLDNPAIYVGTYSKYNNGSIAGKWLDLTNYATKEEFYEACKELHKDEADPEFMFQDFENFPEELYSESGMDERIIEFANMDEHEREIVMEYADACGSLPDDLSDCYDAYFTELSSHNHEQELGEYIVEEGLFGVAIPDELANYIDYEAIGRDSLMGMSVSSNGFVFHNY